MHVGWMGHIKNMDTQAKTKTKTKTKTHRVVYRVAAQLKRHALPSRHFVHDVAPDGEIPEPDITLH